MIKDDIEYKSVEEIKAYQENLLHEALAYLNAHSPYYQRMFESYGINIDKIQHIEDLVKIPFTEKKDLQLSEGQNHRLHYHLRHAWRPRHFRLHGERPTTLGLQ
jgi:phenylacetate-coenzyme A ligase PaaK-like adenylate-forming protein